MAILWNLPKMNTKGTKKKAICTGIRLGGGGVNFLVQTKEIALVWTVIRFPHGSILAGITVNLTASCLAWNWVLGILYRPQAGCSTGSSRQDQTNAIRWINSHLEEDPGVSIPKHQVYDEYKYVFIQIVIYCIPVEVLFHYQTYMSVSISPGTIFLLWLLHNLCTSKQFNLLEYMLFLPWDALCIIYKYKIIVVKRIVEHNDNRDGA